MTEGDFTGRYREGIFVGISKRKGDDEPPLLEEAVTMAYEKARDNGRTPPFRILEIWVDGENPLSEYIVAMQAGG
jgi:hypothetical protein